MNIEKLSKDQMEVILNELLKQKSISKEFIQGTLVANPTNDMKRSTDVFHSFLCDKLHGDSDCNYYEEEGFDDCWRKADHLHWLRNTINFMKENQIDTEALLRTCISLASSYTERLMKEHPAVSKLVALFLARL